MMRKSRSNSVMLGLGILFASGIFVALFSSWQQVNAQANDGSEACAPGRLRSSFGNTDFCNNNIESWDEIILGQVKDGIPAVDNPPMESVEEAAAWMVERSPVIAVEIDGEARAYPQGILMFHEIANDEIAGVPVAVTFCPLCNSSIVFNRDVEGEVLTFGVSGRLRNSDMVMFDRQTESWWQQFTGEGIVGDHTDTLLEFIPSQVMGFGQFAERYPDGLVMARTRGGGNRNPYTNYDQNPQPFLFMGQTDQRLFAVERVLAGIIDGVPMAYPFSTLADEQVINDTLGDEAVVALWQPGVNSALGGSNIDEARDIGTVALYSRTLEDGTVLTFSLGDDNMMVDEETGSTWNLFGEALEGELEGTELRQLIAAPHFWFAWAAFQPETEVYGLE